MPSTYSTNLKLELIANGEQSGTWGTTTNTNLGTLIEEAICGVGTVSILDIDTTITISNGASSTARKLILTLTGTLTAPRNLIVPTIDKQYIVYNNTSGGFPVTVKTSAGTGISVPSGQKRMLYGDSTNINEAINSVGNLNVNGNQSVTGTSTVTGAASVGSLNVGGSSLVVNNNTTLTTTGSTNVTLPTTGTLATRGGTETLTNKTLTSPTVNGGTIASATLTSPSITSATLTTSSLNAAPSAGDNSLLIACTSFVAQALAALIPAGTVVEYAGTSAPAGWLLPYGQVVSQATYPSLYAAIGSTYNTGGEGAGNFRLPDYRGVVLAGKSNMGGFDKGNLTGGTVLGAIIGSESKTVTTTTTGTASGSLSVTTGTASGGIPVTASGGGGVATPYDHTHTGSTTGTLSVSASGNTTTNVVQPTAIVNFLIKT